MNGADVHEGDEAWIAKYREALRVTPVQTSSFTKLRAVLRDAYNIVVSRFRKILERWTRSRGNQLIAARGATNIAQPTPSDSKKSETARISKPALKKRKQTTGRLKPTAATENRRAQRRA